MLPQSEDDRDHVYSLIEHKASTANLNTTNALKSDVSTHPIVKPWLYWLAADVISQWRSLPIEEESFATIFQEVNPKINSDSSPLLTALTISKENQNSIASIDLKYKEICQRNNTTNILKRIISLAEALGSSLTGYTDKSLKQLEANAESIRVNLHQKQQAYFFVLRTAGTKTASACLNSFTAQLQNLIEEYEWQSQEFLDKSRASRHSFEKLSAQVENLLEFDKRGKANSALNALRLIYKYQLSGQVYNVACQLLKEIEAQTQQQLFLLTEVDSCLADLQTWFIEQYPLESMPADFLKNYLSPRVNTVMLLKVVEEWVGTTRYEWADLDGNMMASLKSQILMRLQPACWDFFTECFQINRK